MNLSSTSVEAPDTDAVSGCVRFQTGEQGPLRWKRGQFTLNAEFGEGEGSAVLEVRVGAGDVLLASAKSDGHAIVITSPSVGTTFEPLHVSVNSSTGDIAMSNYLQAASLEVLVNQPVVVRYRSFGLEVRSVRLVDGYIEDTDQPPFPVFGSLENPTSSALSLIVGVRESTDLSKVDVRASVDGAVISSEVGGRPTLFTRSYRIPIDCSSPCDVAIRIGLGDEVTDLRVRVTPHNRSVPQTLVVGLLLLVACAGLGAYFWIHPSSRPQGRLEKRDRGKSPTG